MVKMLASKTVLYKGVIHYAHTPFEVDEADYEGFLLAGYHTVEDKVETERVSMEIADPEVVAKVADVEEDAPTISEDELALEQEIAEKKSLLVELTKEELRETCDTYEIEYKAKDSKATLISLVIEVLDYDTLVGIVDLFRGDVTEE